jgi:hypothetical protein
MHMKLNCDPFPHQGYLRYLLVGIWRKPILAQSIAIVNSLVKSQKSSIIAYQYPVASGVPNVYT